MTKKRRPGRVAGWLRTAGRPSLDTHLDALIAGGYIETEHLPGGGVGYKLTEKGEQMARGAAS